MNLVRIECRWRVMARGRVVHESLEALVREKGYRVASVGRALGLTERQLQRIFTRDVGLTPKEWMRLERMVMARRMLEREEDPLVVARRLGFSHPNSFRREFAGVYGVTVSRFLEIRDRKAWVEG